MATKVPLDADQYLPPMPNAGRQVDSLTENDVLLGRGKGISDYIGNVKYRDFILPRKDEYNALDAHTDKAVFAWEVYHGIRNYGGRFLQLAKSAKQPTKGDVEEKIWEEASEKVALEKIKQSLREKPSPPKASQEGKSTREQAREIQAEESKDENGIKDASETSSEVENEGISSPSLEAPSDVTQSGTTATIATLPAVPQALPTVSSPLPPTLFGSTAIPITVDPRLLLFQQPLPTILQQLLLQQHLSMQRQTTLPDTLAALHLQRNVPVHNTPTVVALATAAQNQIIEERIHQRRMLEARAREILLRQTGSVVGTENEQYSGIAPNDSPTLDVATFEERPGTESSKESDNLSSHIDGTSSESESEKEDAAFTLSALVVAADRPKFTEQDEILEQATLTDEEKAAALCDIVGKYTADDTHQNKRSKKDLDRKSIDFLLDFMRREIERMPIDKKQALLEAQAKCPEDEFSNARLEGFLRSDGMNALLAAERFVNYWEGRREVFGEKYLMRLTLAEALRDDIVAVEAGVHRLLPLADAFGRRIMFIEPHRHTRRGYSSESLVRALWYLLEVFIQESGCDGSGFITIVWDKHTTPFDYDSKVHDKMVYLCRCCLPMKTMPVHICCAPVLLVRLLKPIMKALMDKDARARLIFHDCPESGILDALSEYGIEKHMLPTEMGGLVQLDQTEWIAHRRAIEMEEIQ